MIPSSVNVCVCDSQTSKMSFKSNRPPGDKVECAIPKENYQCLPLSHTKTHSPNHGYQKEIHSKEPYISD